MTSSQLRHSRSAAERERAPRMLVPAGEGSSETANGTPRRSESPRGPAGWVAAGLEATLRARAPGVHASTPLVVQLARQTANQLGLSLETRDLLDIAVRARDIGMIALPDAVVLATAPLSPAEWELVNRHPVIGAELLAELSVVALAAPLVRAHHERWDGGGYPDGQSGEDIPLLSRIIATCDAFAATAGDRPHRRGLGPEAALELICEESGAQFDPATVDALLAVLSRERVPSRGPKAVVAPRISQVPVTRTETGRLDLSVAVAEFDIVPALGPAVERVLVAVAAEPMAAGEVVSAVESDMGLTVMVMQRAQPGAGGRAITNVADAVVALGPNGVAEAVKAAPCAAFPWRTSPLEVLMHRSLVHAQAVARAADRIARELTLDNRDDLLVAALLHDVGKLVLGRALPDYTGDTDRTVTPEARARRERQAWGIDHASLSGVLIRRWGLPRQLADTVAKHHTADAVDDIATVVRLADMTAHHAHGDAIDREALLKLAHVCGVSVAALREILFDLPHAGGSHQRRAEPSPLSPRETSALRGLAEGKVYKAIALEHGTSASTVRTHLHNVYGKLGVADRAQAVLRATEMGWI